MDSKHLEEALRSSGKADASRLPPGMEAPECTKILSFGQSSQIRPVILVDIQDRTMDPDWYSLLLANGRECAVVDLQFDSHNNAVSAGSPRNGTVTLASPILAAASSWPFLTLLTSDGLISLRSQSCVVIALKTVEVGTRPNDFFSLKAFREHQLSDMHSYNNNNSSKTSTYATIPWILCMSYSGQAIVLQCRADTAQDLADRLMRLSIDAFGSGGFLEALNTTFTSTSHAGPEPTPQSRNLFRQYFEAILGLTNFECGSSPGWPTELKKTGIARGTNPTPATVFLEFGEMSKNNRGVSRDGHLKLTESSPVVTAEYPNSLLIATALI